MTEVNQGLKDVVVCDECGSPGQDPTEDMCGEKLGTGDVSYICQDIICPNCRVAEVSIGS